jgi:chorismate mutase
MKNILSLRKKIDSVDQKIKDLLIKRLGLIDEIASFKAVKQLPVFIEKIEKNKLKDIYKNKFLLEIFKSILKESKKHQISSIRRFTKHKKNDKIIL